MELNVRPGPEWQRLARSLQDAERPIRREVSKAVTAAARPAQRAIRTGVPRYMPSGYAPILSGSLRMRTQQAGMQVTIRVSAQGKAHPREIRRMEQGTLRAPSWPRGRRARWRWHGQRIRPGFMSEPVLKQADDFRNRIRAAVQTALNQIAGG